MTPANYQTQRIYKCFCFYLTFNLPKKTYTRILAGLWSAPITLEQKQVDMNHVNSNEEEDEQLSIFIRKYYEVSHLHLFNEIIHFPQLS